MKRIHHHNDSNKFLHIGGVTIPPYETRAVDASLVPDHSEPKIETPDTPPDPIADLLKKNVQTIVPLLPDLTAEDLAAAADREQEGSKRKTLLEAFAAESLRRAASETSAAPGADAIDKLLEGSEEEIIDQFAGMSDEDLVKATEREAAGQNRPKLQDAFTAEALRRAMGDKK